MIKIAFITIALSLTFAVYCAAKVGAEAERRCNEMFKTEYLNSD